MNPVEQHLAEMVTGLIGLAGLADRAGHDALHAAAFSAVLTVIDGAHESGVPLDTDSLGFMAGYVDG